MKFTESVRSFHVPATPWTSAWPPRRPSVPTSRATLVTSWANDRSWSTIRLTVSFSSATSPRASTVIFWERSPLATAVVTRAMLRTWSVRFDAIWFTLSVSSRQAPETPRIRACPPRRPSVPTSPATRVTSAEKADSRSTMEFTTAPMRANSPFTGRPSITSGIFCVRSPSATAEMTRATSLVGLTRSSMRVFTASTRVTHMPVTGPMSSRSVVRPSRPTALDTRTTSLLYRVERSMKSLNALATSLPIPDRRVESRTSACPAEARRSASRSSASSRSVGVRFARPASAPLGPLSPAPARCSLAGAAADRVAGVRPALNAPPRRSCRTRPRRGPAP